MRLRITTLALLLGLAGCPADAPSIAPEPTPLHATRKADVAELCGPELRSWAVLDDAGAWVATTRGRCLGAIEHPEQGPLWHFVAQYQVVGEPRSSWELHTWLDAFGLPRNAEFRTPSRVSKYAWRGEALELRRFGDLMIAEASADLWIVPAHALYLRELMLRLGVGVDAAGVHQRSLDPERDAIGELALNFGTDALTGPHATLRLAGEDLAALRIIEGLAGERPRYRSLAADEPDALAEFLPAHPLPHYAAPDDLELVALEIPGQAEAPTLAAELVLPRTRDADAPLPGVLFLAGAGPQDRHGLIPGTGIDMGSHELHDALARAGFAVLRFDDRGVGGSELGDEPAPGFRTLVDDGRRALASLAARPEVDPRRLIVIGHGEGALMASILAAEGARVGGRRRPLAGLVLLAAPGRNLRELVYDEIRASMLGRRDAEVRAAVQRAREVHDAALADRDLPASSVGARTWMIEAFAEDPLKRLKAVKVPVLALQGEKDFQVSPERDFGPIAELLAKRRSCDSQLIAGVDHLFKPEPGVSTPGHYSDLERRVAPEVIARIVEWLATRSPR
ncbi:alpha/beta hydrolase family protein [Nannocystaceae bacterium ST9]